MFFFVRIARELIMYAYVGDLLLLLVAWLVVKLDLVVALAIWQRK